jgi:hypothetical protein
VQLYFVKSLEEDFVSKTLKGKKKVSFQTVTDMVRRKRILPNTKSFGRKMRLSCTILDKQYTKTYRPQGIIFQTKQKPDYISPFDLVLLSDAKKLVVHYYRIKDNLHMYYSHKLIPGYEKFMFKDFHALLKKYPSPKAVLKSVNAFRMKHGHPRLERQKYRLIQYNEVVYHRIVNIKPIAIFGYRKNTRQIAKRLGLPYFVSAKSFYKKVSA